MITQTDMEIISHVEHFGFITIDQAKNMFYPSKSGYDMARRRLNKLVKTNYLKMSRNESTNEKIFYINNSKNVTLHSMLLMNYYSKLISNNVQIKVFQKEKEWADGAVRSDGFCIFEYSGYKFYQLIEVIVSHNDSNMKKYETLYQTGEVQSQCDGEFPQLIIIDNAIHNKPIVLKNIEIVTLDFLLNDVGKVFV
jgi:hypothetical protein